MEPFCVKVMANVMSILGPVGPIFSFRNFMRCEMLLGLITVKQRRQVAKSMNELY